VQGAKRPYFSGPAARSVKSSLNIRECIVITEHIEDLFVPCMVKYLACAEMLEMRVVLLNEGYVYAIINLATSNQTNRI
jgi:hypothetical protein